MRDEAFLTQAAVREFLEGETFETKRITDVFLGLQYRPNPETGEGACPVFQLSLVRADEQGIGRRR